MSKGRGGTLNPVTTTMEYTAQTMEEAGSSTRVFKRNVVYTSFRDTTQRALYSIKKKVSTIQTAARTRAALRTLNESFESPVPPARKALPVLRRPKKKMAEVKTPTREAHSGFYDGPAVTTRTPFSSPLTPHTLDGFHSELSDFESPQIFDYKPSRLSRGRGLHTAMRRSMRQLMRKSERTPGSAKRLVNQRPRQSKLIARRRIQEVASPRKTLTLRSPGSVQREVNELAMGIQELNAMTQGYQV